MSSYTVLGITRSASDDEVRLAYKHKALECHPDRNVKDKDAATRNFIEVNTAYHAILRERERKAARSKSSTSSTSDEKCSSTASQSEDKKTPPKAGPSGSSNSSSFASSTHSTPSSTPSSSPFSTPTSSPYSTPASSPASSTTSLPEEEKASKFSSFRSRRSTTCEDVEDEDDAASTAGSSTTSHTASVPPDPGTSKEGHSSSSKPRRAKLRKPQPKPKPTPESDDCSSGDCKCSCHHSASSKKPHGTPSASHDRSDTRSQHTKHHAKRKETELKEYYDTLPSLKDYPTADLAAEWVYPISLNLDDIFHGKRLCYRITRRYLSGKTKSVVLDVDVPAGCRCGTKIVFRDAGHERRDGTKQDVVFLVQEAKHERFVRGCQWDGGGGGGNDKDDSRERRKSRDGDREVGDEKEKETDSQERKTHRRRSYGEEDLVMEVRLPWVERLKDEKARIVVSGIDGKELMFEVDCRNTTADNKEKRGKMTGMYVIEGAGMPVRANSKSADDGTKSQNANGSSGTRGKLIVRWEIFAPAPSSSSKWESFKQIFTFGK